MLEEADIQPSQFQDSLIFFSIYNDVIWWTPQKTMYVLTMQSVQPESMRAKENGHFLVLASQRIVFKFVRQTMWTMEFDSGENDANILKEGAFCIQVLISIVKMCAPR